MKGSIPEFKDYGLPSDFIGTSVNAIQYPSIFKALMNMFQRDNRWSSAELLSLERKDDNLFMKVKAVSVTNDNFIINVPI